MSSPYRTAVAFFSISVWTSGDVLVGGAARAFGGAADAASDNVAVATVLFLLGIIAFGGTFDPGYAGMCGAGADAATNALHWPSFVGAALIVMSNPVSFGAFLGDWARYIPRETPAWKTMAAAFGAQIATLVPFGFGLVTASIVATNAPQFVEQGNYVGGLLAISPGWYFLPVCLIALIGGMSTGTTALYGTGLDFSSVFPRFSRVQATVFIGVVAIAFIFVGRFAFNVVQSISTFAVLIVTCTAPWMVVMMIGWLVRRGWYDSDALQVLNRRQRGGRYWFTHGWNWRGLGGLGLAAVLYPALLFAFPEPADAFGPDGARIAPTGPPAGTPITFISVAAQEFSA